ncbi:MAG: GWxTD domain-containing protein [bacterium]
MNKFGCYFTLVIYVLASGTMALSKPIKLNIDYARFKLDSDSHYLEIYYSIKRSDLTFVKTADEKFLAEAYVRFKIYQGDSLWLNQAWKVPSTIADTSNMQSSQNIVDIIRYEIKPGSYHLQAFVQDLQETSKVDSVELPIEIQATPDIEVQLSDIQLATSIRKIKKDPNNVFYKNTLEVVPNPSTLFGAGVPMLFYYVEGYNLQSVLNMKRYQTYCYISETENDTAHARLSRKQIKKIVGNTSVEIGAINISSLPSGSYYFNFAILDMQNQQQAGSSKKMFVYNPAVDAKQLVQVELDSALARSPLSKMPDKALEQEFEYIKYICSKEAKEYFSQLDSPEAKRRFLFQFWLRRDSDRQTFVNEFRQEYLKRVAVANQKFKTLGREGWHTDMGRVYILYGEPDNRQWFRSTSNTKPYEIWNYFNIEGGVDFIFVDLSGFKQFRLIHSNKIGEVKNENWQLAIKEHVN